MDISEVRIAPGSDLVIYTVADGAEIRVGSGALDSSDLERLWRVLCDLRGRGGEAEIDRSQIRRPGNRKAFVGAPRRRARGGGSLVRRAEILVGLDLGSSRIKVVVADTADRELPEILGIGEADSLGIEAGVIVNMERAALSIRSAVEDAEESAEVDIGRVLVTLDGEHIKGIDSRGVVAVSRSGGEITKAEVNAVLEAAKTLALPVGRTILDAKAQEFFVDGQRGIRDPIGMSGVRLGSKVHIVTASQQAVDNVVRAVRKAGLKMSGMSFKPLAAGTAVALRGREGAGGASRQPRRRNHRPRAVSRGDGQAHGRHRMGRGQRHERHSRGSQDADRQGRAAQAGQRVRLRFDGRGRYRRDPDGGRTPAARVLGADPGRHHRAEDARDIRDGDERGAEHGLLGDGSRRESC